MDGVFAEGGLPGGAKEGDPSMEDPSSIYRFGLWSSRLRTRRPARCARLDEKTFSNRPETGCEPIHAFVRALTPYSGSFSTLRQAFGRVPCVGERSLFLKLIFAYVGELTNARYALNEHRLACRVVDNVTSLRLFNQFSDTSR